MQVAITAIRLFLYIAILPILCLVCLMCSAIAFMLGFLIFIIDGELDAFDFSIHCMVFPYDRMRDIISDLIYEIRHI